MRTLRRLLAVLALAMVAGGCNPNEREYLRDGIGTDIAWTDVASATELQNLYLEHLCRQTLPFVGAGVPSCSQEQLPPTAWPLIVQAGMNDIDLRCDAYLAWLDQKKRETAAVLTEISAIRVAVDALINPTITASTGPRTLAAVAAAFGLATATVSNFNSLLLNVDHTTVQSVVFLNRRDFREQVRALPINNKPIAVHALRSYLTICMPMTIAAKINSTVTIVEQAGPNALERNPFSSTSTIAAPVRAGGEVGQKPDRQIPPNPQFDDMILGNSPIEFPLSTIKRMQDVLCVPPSDIGKASGQNGFLIDIFEASDQFEAKDNRLIVRDGKLDVNERDVLRKSNKCPRNVALNFYERTVFLDGATPDLQERVDAFVIDQLNKVKIAPPLAKGTPLSATRDRIRAVRVALTKDPNNAARLKSLPDAMANQWTRDLFDLLSAMPAPQ